MVVLATGHKVRCIIRVQVAKFIKMIVFYVDVLHWV